MSSVIGDWPGRCSEWRLHSATSSRCLCSDLAGVTFKIHTKKSTRHQLLSDCVTKHSPAARADAEIPWNQPSGRPPAILALNFPCHTRRRIYSDLYRLRNKLSSGRWSAGLAARLDIRVCVCVTRHIEIFKICVDMFTALSYLAACWRFAFESGCAVSQTAAAFCYFMALGRLSSVQRANTL